MRKIILWNKSGNSKAFDIVNSEGVNVSYTEGLQFHIRTPEDEKFVRWFQAKLRQQFYFYSLNPEDYSKKVADNYQRRFGKSLDWNNLKTYSEKMQWIRLYDNTPLKTRLADKFLVKQWIADKIGTKYLIPLLGVWNNADEIDFNALPNQFVLKCNHGCGFNIICRDKNNFNIENAREKLNAWLAIDFGSLAIEPHYNNIAKKIICEKFMSETGLIDINNYKFWCFNGKIKFCGFESGRTADGDIENLRIDYFDMNWNHMNFERADHTTSENPEKIQKPKNFELMKELAAELCKDFIHVRVDFYEIEDKVYFGEMTFTPGACNFKFKSEGTDEYLGSLMKLPIEK